MKLVKDTIQEVEDTYKTNDEQAINNIEFSVNDQLYMETLVMIIRGSTFSLVILMKGKIQKKQIRRYEKIEEEISLDIQPRN